MHAISTDSQADSKEGNLLPGAQPALVYHLETPELGIAKRLTVGAGSRCWCMRTFLIHTTANDTVWTISSFHHAKEFDGK